MFRLYKPHIYQGPDKLLHKKGYFEGWYFKFVSKEGKAVAVIPGVSLQKDRSTVFIQTVDGQTGESSYTTFPSNEIAFNKGDSLVEIGGNRFGLNGAELGDRIPLKGKVTIPQPSLYKTRLYRPGIMGWYRYMPFMECYHGVVSTDHALSGTLETNRGTLDFSGGKGYVEKDWGTSFPSSYIWMQTNCFERPDVSFMLSLARIPWFGSWFSGFLGFLKIGDKTITFSTYTGARLHLDKLSPNSVSIRVDGQGSGLGDSLKRGEAIVIDAQRQRGSELMAPQIGSMERRISESIDGVIFLSYKQNKRSVFEGRSRNSGLEIVGKAEELGKISG